MAKKPESKKPTDKVEAPSAAKQPEVPKKDLAVAPQGRAVATRGGGALAGRGFENIEKSDLLLPRLKLLQAMSPEVNDLNQKPGTMFIGLSNKNYGEKIVVIPVLHFRSRIKWNPKDDGGGIDCSAPDGKTPRETKYAANCAACQYPNWRPEEKKKKDQQPQCTLYDNFLCLVDGATEPVIIPFERSKAKVAKKWYSVGGLKGGDMFDWQYEITVVKEKNADDEQFFNYSVRDIGKPTPDPRKQLCLNIWNSLVGKTISEVNTEKDEPATAPAGAGGGQQY